MKALLISLLLINFCKALEIVHFQETRTGFERIDKEFTRSQKADLASGDYFLLLNVIIEGGVQKTAVVFSEAAKNIQKENLGCRFAPKKQRVKLIRERLILHLIGWHKYELHMPGEAKERFEYMPLPTEPDASSRSSELDLSLFDDASIA